MDENTVWLVILALIIGWFAHKYLSRGYHEYLEARGCRKAVRGNTPWQNLQMIRACLIEMRCGYQALPADKFVTEMLEWCDRTDEWLRNIEREVAEHSERSLQVVR